MAIGRLNFVAPTSLEYFAALVAQDAGLPLLEAAASIAQDENPQTDIQATIAEVDTLAERLKRRIPADAVPIARLRCLNRYFFDELGFAGNVNNFYDPANSYLDSVLKTRRGIPISLGVLYAEFAGHVGLSAQGVSFPGHFLVKLGIARNGRRGEVVIDPLNGHSLSRDALEEMLQPFKRSRGLVGEFDVPVGLFLQAASPRDIIARMLRNLKEIHTSTSDWHRLVAVLRRLMVLLPDAWEERRDCGLAFAQLGRPADAVDCIEAYLAHRPDAEDGAPLRLRVDELRALRHPPLN